ncbi:hypothetical protein FOCC_FOCC015652, partial [Frankliniella occidentalis]
MGQVSDHGASWITRACKSLKSITLYYCQQHDNTHEHMDTRRKHKEEMQELQRQLNDKTDISHCKDAEVQEHRCQQSAL